ncbi:MAG: N-acetyl sugar amidotransferase, partial [Actinomycetota bacterium]|nr:N-acetyl sugar amidotransferase [Actinomycetota bacterium]
MGRDYQMCKRCVMDTTDPDIVFDEHGICNHCKAYFEKEKKIVFKG